MHRLIIYFGLILLLLAADVVFAKTINSPTMPPERAIEVAQEYVKNNKIDVSRHFLAKVEYFGLYDEYQKPYWRIEWHYLGAVKGGQIFVIVFPDGTAFLQFGE